MVKYHPSSVMTLTTPPTYSQLAPAPAPAPFSPPLFRSVLDDITPLSSNVDSTPPSIKPTSIKRQHDVDWIESEAKKSKLVEANVVVVAEAPLTTMMMTLATTIYVKGELFEWANQPSSNYTSPQTHQS
jgi:hypothetical protein